MTQHPSPLPLRTAAPASPRPLPRSLPRPLPWLLPSPLPYPRVILTVLWSLLYLTALFTPPLLDDADATHASAARHILTSGDWVTLYVNGIRYLEKAPLPYWFAALSFRVFGFNTFAAHLPQAIAVLLLTLVGYQWSRRAFGGRAAFYTGLATLTSTGVFLFTRIFIPEVWLSLFLALALYLLLESLNPIGGKTSKGAGVPIRQSDSDTGSGPSTSSTRRGTLFGKTCPYLLWVALALAVLTKGLVALVFFFGAAAVYLALTAQYKHIRRLKPITGPILFFSIAAPWHILAGLRNTGGMNGHGFFWFYFINEHFLRFLGRRIPMDYNKLPAILFWSLHLVWLFPWSLFAPSTAVFGWRLWRSRRDIHARLDLLDRDHDGLRSHRGEFASCSTLLLALYSGLVLLFFSFSTNQEYYTFPAYLPLLMLLTAALTRAEATYTEDRSSRRWILLAHGAFALLGLIVAGTLAFGLWNSRHLAFVPDIGSVLAHRGVGDYTLSMSHLFDLTGPSFAALRLPASLAALTFAAGPGLAWILRSRRRHLASTVTLALTSGLFFLAAHIAFARFSPMLSSEDFAAEIQHLQSSHTIATDTEILLYGDQSYGSSIPFYLGHPVLLVEGRSSSMLFGSTFPDAPHLFLNNADLLARWGTGPRKILFVPLEERDAVDRLLGPRQYLLKETSGKALLTDRPL